MKKTTAFYIDEDLKEWLKSKADLQQRSVSFVLNEMLKEIKKKEQMR
jgi:hypothetical protein